MSLQCIEVEYDSFDNESLHILQVLSMFQRTSWCWEAGTEPAFRSLCVELPFGEMEVLQGEGALHVTTSFVSAIK